MPGPGEYVGDPTEGITRVEDLPPPMVVSRSRNFAHRRCPVCGHSAYRDRVCTRRFHDLGDLATGRPRVIALTFSQHYCTPCDRYFGADTLDLADPDARYTRRVVLLAVRLVAEDGLPYRTASWHLWRDHRVFVPFATIQNWVEAAGEKRRPHRRTRVSGLGVERFLWLHRGRRTLRRPLLRPVRR
jgi:hypothetical protein